MKLTVNEATMKLQAGQLLKLNGARGTRLNCREGLLWVTQEGLTRDDFLAAGTSMVIATQGVVLIEALAETTLSLVSREVAANAAQARLSPA